MESQSVAATENPTLDLRCNCPAIAYTAKLDTRDRSGLHVGYVLRCDFTSVASSAARREFQTKVMHKRTSAPPVMGAVRTTLYT